MKECVCGGKGDEKGWGGDKNGQNIPHPHPPSPPASPLIPRLAGRCIGRIACGIAPWRSTPLLSWRLVVRGWL